MFLYIFISIMVAIFAPEIGTGFADTLRDSMNVTWDGYWFWVIGLFLSALAD